MTRTTLALLLGLSAPAGATALLKPLDFSYRPLSQGQMVEARATAEGGTGRIAVHGQMGTPNPCQTLTATRTRSGTTVVLRVVSRPKPDVMCVATLGGYVYDATLNGLRPGTYRLRVTHQLPQTGNPAERTVLDRTVRVR
ncbi:MAG: hypothetical protein JO040_11055 [Gemmatimonadetes bacterium]|nr:hypothetical protein [Gemmatimonadota bacterium]